MSAARISIIVITLVIIVVAGSLIVRNLHHHATSTTVFTGNTDMSMSEIRYLPLGDSYTIGESVQESERWPNQLVTMLKSQGVNLQITANPAVTGYTTQNLIDKELPLVTMLKPDFVTVAIGVNDYVQGVDEQTFGRNLEFILTSLQRQLAKPGNIMLLTIPDYGATPTGAGYGNPTVSRKGIENFNTILKQKAAKYALPVADIYPASQQVSADPGLVANDGLHPSGKQYGVWSKVIIEAMGAAKLLGVKSGI